MAEFLDEAVKRGAKVLIGEDLDMRLIPELRK